MEVEDKSISNMISYLRFFRYFSSSIWEEPKVYPVVWSTVSSHSKMSPEISAFAAKDLVEKTRRHDEAFWNIIVVSSSAGIVSIPHMDNVEVPDGQGAEPIFWGFIE